ncbi:MAG: hypothetical protein PHE55_12725 [Methylococcaceae bacterium]|nr:hypothetical protein [Methylococcaceae bacterium]
MSRRELILLSWKGLLACSILSCLGWYFGEWLGNGLLPMIEMVLRLLAPEFSPALKVVPESHDYLIQLSLWALHPIPLTSSRVIPSGQELTVGTHLMHTLVPMVIELSILLVWPVQHWTQRWVLLSFGLITVLSVIALITPALLLGLLEISFQEAALQLNEPRTKPWVLSWMIFCEMGGRWLLPIAAACWCIQLQRWLRSDIA